MYKIMDATVLVRPCIICGEDVIVSPYEAEKAKVCGKCRDAVLKMRKQEEGEADA